MFWWITRRWRTPATIAILFILELCFSVAALALYAIADPNLYRTKLWLDGYHNGFNSSPAEILYSYANHRPIQPPLVWSQFITSFNVTISIVSLFSLLAKSILFILGFWPPVLSFLLHAILLGLFTYSAHAQTSPDMSDKLHPRPGAPWYLTHSCDVAFKKSNVGYCRQAKGVYAVTLILTLLFAANTIMAIYSAVPTKDQRRAKSTSLESGDANRAFAMSPGKPSMAMGEDGVWEMYPLPPNTIAKGKGKARGEMIMTPRTLAFNILGGAKGVN